MAPHLSGCRNSELSRIHLYYSQTYSPVEIDFHFIYCDVKKHREKEAIFLGELSL